MTKKNEKSSATHTHARAHNEKSAGTEEPSGLAPATSSRSTATSQPADGTPAPAEATSPTDDATSQPTSATSPAKDETSRPGKATSQPSEGTSQATDATSPTKKPTSRAALGTAAATQDDSAITDAQIQQFLSSCDTLASILGAVASPMTIEQRRKQPKLKTGGEALVPGVLNLADEYGVSIPGASTDDARADIQLVKRLQPIETKLIATTQLVADALTTGRGRFWSTAMTAYGMLTKLVPRFPALQGQLVPMATLLARTHKDAPTALRKAEAKSLSRSRAARKAREAAAAAGKAPAPGGNTPPTTNH